MSNICVIGAGRVGLVIAACFAHTGHNVTCVDTDEEKVKQLWRKEMPFYEPKLKKMVCDNLVKGSLRFTTSYILAVKAADLVFIAVGTPTDSVGRADVISIYAAIANIADVTNGPITIVIKSTVPVGENEKIIKFFTENTPLFEFDLVANPEFLQEGNAINSCLSPDRIVLGASNIDAAWKVADLYSSPFRGNCPVVITDFKSAEMIKYASNSYLATRISFINEIADICNILGADVAEVTRGMGYDRRIGHNYLSPGLGYGGSCFPKDLAALKYQANQQNYYPFMLQATMGINADRLAVIENILYEELKSLLEKQIGILGLAFKPSTDDIRESPALKLIDHLLEHGTYIRVYDPSNAMESTKQIFPKVVCCESAYEVADGADALIVATEWRAFKYLNMKEIKELMAKPILIDGRNIYEPERMKELGFTYYGMGRR